MTIGFCTVYDAYLCLAHLYLALRYDVKYI